jgi:hypothetical protein
MAYDDDDDWPEPERDPEKLEVVSPTERCAITTFDPDTLERDSRVVRPGRRLGVGLLVGISVPRDAGQALVGAHWPGPPASLNLMLRLAGHPAP